MWILVLAGLFFYYMFAAIRFANKVHVFNSKIELGMTNIEVLFSLGRPSWVGEVSHSDGKKLEYFYDGKPFLREDIVLDFELETGKLAYKSRGMHFGPRLPHSR